MQLFLKGQTATGAEILRRNFNQRSSIILEIFSYLRNSRYQNGYSRFLYVSSCNWKYFPELSSKNECTGLSDIFSVVKGNEAKTKLLFLILGCDDLFQVSLG